MNYSHISADETISELESVTAEMATLQDLSDARLSDLLETRGTLIRRLISTDWDASDNRLASIIANADDLQERLRQRCETIRQDLSNIQMTGVLVGAVRFTCMASPAIGLDISA
jgi:hypothetical protein